MQLVFGPFALEPTSGELHRDGRPVDLQPKPLAILLHLVLHRDRWVRKEELLARVWPGIAVSSAAVASALRDLREALGDDGTQQSFVRTMRGRGYRFVAPVEERARERSLLRTDAGASREHPLAAVAGSLLPRASPFVGRHDALATLEHALDGALAGRGGLALLAGEPGIGKSRIAQELCGRARAHGIPVHGGTCSETGGAPAYWPWVRVLRSVVAAREPTALRAALDWRAPHLAQLLPELRTAWPDLPPLPRDEGDAARFQLFDAIASFLRLVAAERGLLVHLDDLHRGDEGSLALLRFLVAELSESRMLIVAGHRDAEADRGAALDALLASAARLDNCVRIRLEGLPPGEVQALVAELLGTEPEEALVSAVQARTDGNPFFVRELVALVERDGSADSDSARPLDRTVPHRVRDIVRARLTALSATCHEILATAAVIGREFDPELVAHVLDRDPAHVARAAEEAVGAGLLIEGDERLRFSHVLVRDVVYEAERRSRRAAKHRRVAEALEKLAASDPDARLAALAHHYAEAVPAGTRRQAIDYARRAGWRAAERYAFLDAAHHFERALVLLEGDPSATAAERCDMLLEVGHAYEPSGLQDRHRDAFRRAAAVARELRDGERLARAALGFALGILIGDVDAEASRMLEDALAATGAVDSSLRVQVLARLAHLVENEGQSERADALLAEAAERVRDLDASLALVKNRGNLWMGRGMPPEPQIANRREGIRLAELAGDLVQARRHRAAMSTFLLVLGDRTGAERELARAAAGDRVDWMLDLQRRMYSVLTSLATGSLEGVEQEIQACGRLVASRSLPHRGPLAELYFLRREQERLTEIAGALLAMPAQRPGDAMARASLALLLAEIGRSDEARLLLDIDGVAGSDGRLDMATAAILTEACDVLGERRPLPALLEVLAPYEPYHLVLGGAALTLGPTVRYLGLLHALAGDVDAAERCFAAAQIRSRAMGWTLWERYAQLDEAKLQLTRRPGDTSRGRELAAAVLSETRPAGLLRLAHRAQALLDEPAGRRGLHAV